MMSSNKKLYRMILSALFLALAMVLPFLTGQIPQIGNTLCPMHLPVLLCGFFCGPWYGLGVGLIAPLLRFLLFGMPPIIPTGISMSLELAAYGLISGWLYSKLPSKKVYVYVSLLGAMIGGRIVWGITRLVLYGLGIAPISWELFWSFAFLAAIPGIFIQLVLVPVLVFTLEKYTCRK